jgi:membrane carboxypeptidase/penicillin-binding protein PbpC
METDEVQRKRQGTSARSVGKIADKVVQVWVGRLAGEDAQQLPGFQSAARNVIVDVHGPLNFKVALTCVS